MNIVQRRGALIVIEGVDRSGKSTQCKKLIESLLSQNIKATLISFPDRTTLTGQLINDYLKNKDVKLNDQSVHLLFAANRWENLDKIKSLIYGGTTLIIDRYSYSGIAFSTAKGMNMKWCENPEIGLPKPDLVFLLALTPEEAKKRSGFGVERYETEALQTKVAELFGDFAKTKKGNNWKVIDASAASELVHEILLKFSLETIKHVGIKDLESLTF